MNGPPQLALLPTSAVADFPRTRITGALADAAAAAEHCDDTAAGLIALALNIAERLETCPIDDRRGAAALARALMEALDAAALTPSAAARLGVGAADADWAAMLAGE